MSSPLLLYAYDRLVRSPFGLLGTDENALSFALGYTFQQCPPLLRWFLKQIGVDNVPSKRLREARIDPQRYPSGDARNGITDIEIHLPGCFHVIVEAKIGMATPSLDQCRRYLPRLHETGEPVSKLVALVQSPDQSFVEAYARENEDLHLVSFSWPELISACGRIMLSPSVVPETKLWVRSFYTFLDQEYPMKAFTTEVWILPIGTTPLWPGGMTHWDLHQKYMIYWDQTQPNVRPLYLAFRVNGMVDGIYRVAGIEHDIPIMKRMPELANVTKEWAQLRFTVWHFEPKVELPTPLRTGSGMYNRRVRCDLDLLLACQTIQEIEEKMGKRRGQTEE